LSSLSGAASWIRVVATAAALVVVVAAVAVLERPNIITTAMNKIESDCFILRFIDLLNFYVKG
jgi:hypothetical protein